MQCENLSDAGAPVNGSSLVPPARNTFKSVDAFPGDLFDLGGPTIIRVYKDRANPYVQINRRVLEDNRLSWAARGVMAYLLAKPDNWEVRPGDLQRNGGCGRDAVRSILAELEAHGYLWRHKVNGGGGKFTWVHRVYESPELNPLFRSTLKAVRDEPGVEKPPTGKPSMEQLSPEKPPVAEPATAQPSVAQPATEKASSYINNQVLNNQSVRKQENQRHTQTTEAPASPPPGGGCVLSKFSPEECRRYADHLHKTGQGIINPGGFAMKIRRTGECDAQIAAFLGVAKGPSEVARSDVAALLSEGPAGRHKFYALLNKLYEQQHPGSELAGALALLRGDVFSVSNTELLERYRQLEARWPAATVESSPS
jgi:hypothetical protein